MKSLISQCHCITYAAQVKMFHLLLTDYHLLYCIIIRLLLQCMLHYNLQSNRSSKCKTMQPGSFSRLQEDLMPSHHWLSGISCPFNTESSTRWLCWPSRVAAAPQHRHTSVVTSRLASVNGHSLVCRPTTGQAVHQDRLRETSSSLFCANCLELVAWDNNQRWLTTPTTDLPPAPLKPRP